MNAKQTTHPHPAETDATTDVKVGTQHAGDHGGHDKHAGHHVEMFRRRFDEGFRDLGPGAVAGAQEQQSRSTPLRLDVLR